MLTLTPDVDFDLDFVNAWIRDGTGSMTNNINKPFCRGVRYALISLQTYTIYTKYLLDRRSTFFQVNHNLLKMGALMYQIHMKLEVVLLFGFGFRLSYLESLLRSILDSYTKLDQSILKERKCFSMARENNRLNCRDNRLFVT